MTNSNTDNHTKKRTFGYIEAVFDMLYLSVIFVLGIYLLFTADSILNTLFGVMAIVLCIGDSFHLIPRIILSVKQSSKVTEHTLGIGKKVTGIGMTIFYVILWHIGIIMFEPEYAVVFTILIYLLAIIRVIFCVSERTHLNKGKVDIKKGTSGIYRNIPFVIIGIIVAVLYAIYGADYPAIDMMWVAIVLSFAFYLPVVFGVSKYPKLGMLMLPKSCIYVWIVSMGLFL